MAATADARAAPRRHDGCGRWQGLGQRLQPLTICEYDLECEPVADLRTDTARTALGIDYADLACPWLSAVRAGQAGMIVPSFAPGAGAGHHNIVLWRWGPDLPTRITVFDPGDRLPRDQLSWQRR